MNPSLTLTKSSLASVLFIVFFWFDSQIHRIFVRFWFHRFSTLSLVPRKDNKSVGKLWKENFTNVQLICESNRKKTIKRSAARGHLASHSPNFIVVTHFCSYKTSTTRSQVAACIWFYLCTYVCRAMQSNLSLLF